MDAWKVEMMVYSMVDSKDVMTAGLMDLTKAAAMADGMVEQMENL